MTIDKLLEKIDQLESYIGSSGLPTLALLRASTELRLDWGFERAHTFRDEYNEGATKPILVKGLSTDSHPLNARRLDASRNMIILSLVDGFMTENELTKEKLDEVHRQIIKEGGSYRTVDVFTTNSAKHSFSNPARILSDVAYLLGWYNAQRNNSAYHPLFLAAEFHYRFVKIHPYVDGNGTLARIIASMILLRKKIPPPLFFDEERQLYINRLKQADAGNMEGWIQLIGERIIRSQELLLKESN